MRILLIEDNPADAHLVRAMLLEGGGADVAIEVAPTLAAGRARLGSGDVDAILLDLRLPDSSGIETFRGVRAAAGSAPIVILSGLGDEELALLTVQEGAQHFLVKGKFDGHTLRREARFAIERKRSAEVIEATRVERLRLASFAADLGGALTAGESLPSVLNRCAEAMIRHLDAVAASVWTFDDGAGTLELRASAGAPPHPEGRPRRIDDASIGFIARERNAHVTNDVPHDRTLDGEPWARREGVVAFAGYPLIVEERLVGVMAVLSPRPFTDFVLDALTTAAGSVALFIQRKGEERARKEAEDRLRLAQRMEAIGRLAGGIAHDFNNLLTTILGYAELSLARVAVDSDLHNDIGEIRDAARRASDLTRQLLAFGRRQLLQPRVLDLNAVIADLDKMLRRLIGENIDLETELDPRLGRIYADPGQISQVLMNLVLNARDAMPHGGTITIETANTDRAESPGVPATEHYVVFGVRDTGVGMDRETLSRVFEPFFTTKEMGKGTGLGLATTYGIVKQSGGFIWADSQPGRGSRFRVYLPQAQELAIETPGAPAELGDDRGDERILLVEDDDSVRGLAVAILKGHGYTVVGARTGEEAIQLCQARGEAVDLVLTDVVMPGMSGLELAKRVASLHPEARILLMSGYAEDQIAQHGVVEPSVPYLQKPFTPGTLLRAVREALDVPVNLAARG